MRKTGVAQPTSMGTCAWKLPTVIVILLCMMIRHMRDEMQVPNTETLKLK